jgi:hypothetical protein
MHHTWTPQHTFTNYRHIHTTHTHTHTVHNKRLFGLSNHFSLINVHVQTAYARTDTYTYTHTQYTAKDYLVAATVSGGCALFLLTGSVTSSAAKRSDQSTSMLGILMMVCLRMYVPINV